MHPSNKALLHKTKEFLNKLVLSSPSIFFSLSPSEIFTKKKQFEVTRLTEKSEFSHHSAEKLRKLLELTIGKLFGHGIATMKMMLSWEVTSMLWELPFKFRENIAIKKNQSASRKR